MVGRAFFVAGDEEGDLAAVVGVVGDEALGGHYHGRQAAFHVGGAAATEHAVGIDQGVERIVLPGLHRAGRHYIGVTGKAQHRTILGTVGGPEVIDVFDAHRLEHEAGIAQALHHLFLAIGVHWGHRGATDQVAGQFKGRREVGWGRH
ncbi:hypothetical protein D3C77_586650 [compost metagenome]